MFSSIAFAAVAIVSVLPIGAADDTVTLYLPLVYGDLPTSQIYQASIIDADSTARTYSLSCPPSEPSCPLRRGLTLTEGPDLIRYTHAETAGRFPATTSLTCIYASDAGQCEGTVAVPAATGTDDYMAGAQLAWAYAGLEPVTATVVAGQSFLKQDLQPAFPATTTAATATGSGARSGVVASSSVNASASVNGAQATAKVSSGVAAPTGGVALGSVLAGAVAAIVVAL